MARSKLNFLIQFLLYYLAIINLGKTKKNHWFTIRMWNYYQ